MSRGRLDFLEEGVYHFCLCFLMQDVSCNEITALPQQIGQLKSLRELNVRRNYLKVLPQGKKRIKQEMFILFVCLLLGRR